MRRAFVTLAAAFVAAGTGCMAGHAAQAGPRPVSAQAREEAPVGMGARSMQECPMSVPGTQVSVADTPDGESITFTTSPDHTADLRSRVRAMADMHNRHHQGAAMGGMHGDMQHPEMMGSGSGAASPGGAAEHGMMPPPSRAAVEDVDGGARITVTPSAPADLEQLRSTMRMHAQHMQQSGTCGMGEGGTR